MRFYLLVLKEVKSQVNHVFQDQQKRQKVKLIPKEHPIDVASYLVNIWHI